jgi:hypothetical protein
MAVEYLHKSSQVHVLDTKVYKEYLQRILDEASILSLITFQLMKRPIVSNSQVENIAKIILNKLTMLDIYILSYDTEGTRI